MKRLSNLTVQSTLFVPDNNGLPDNQVSHTQASSDSCCICEHVSPVRLRPRVPADSVSAGHRVPPVRGSGASCHSDEERQQDQDSRRQSDRPRSRRSARPVGSGQIYE